MSTIGSLSVNVVANTEKFSRGMKSARKDLDVFAKGVDRVKGILVGFGASLAAGFAIDSLRGVSNEIDRIAKDSIRLGIGIDKLQGLGRVAELSGASAGELVAGIGKMEVALANGAKAFDKLRLNVAQLRGMRPEEAFLKIADTIKDVGDQSERMSITREIFGKGGASLLPTIMQGSDVTAAGMDKYGKLTEEQAAAAQKANDAATELSFAFKDLKAAVVGATAGYATKLAKSGTVLAGGDINSGAWDKAIGSMTEKDFDSYARENAGKQHNSRGGLLGMLGVGYSENVNSSERDAAIARRLKAENKVLHERVTTELQSAGLIGGSGFGGIDVGASMRMQDFGMKSMVSQQQLQLGMGMMMGGALGQTPDEFAGQQEARDKVAAMEKRIKNLRPDSMSLEHGGAALEKGTAAAFTQAHKSSEQIKLLDEAKAQKALLVKQLEELKKIANRSGALQLPVVNIN